jgi:hypothetical protein
LPFLPSSSGKEETGSAIGDSRLGFEALEAVGLLGSEKGEGVFSQAIP